MSGLLRARAWWPIGSRCVQISNSDGIMSSMTAYLQTWTEGATIALERAGEPITHAASDQYHRMGVTVGDTLYIAYLDSRHLHLLGRLTVDEILTQDQVEQMWGEDVWVAKYHAIGHDSDIALFDLRVPRDVLRALEFVRADGTLTTLDIQPNETVSGQALQSIRRLTPASVALLDEVLAESTTGAPRKMARGAADQAIELHAMAAVGAYYASQGWMVEDVSQHRPYDLVCQKGDAIIHVEVKGLSGPATRIQLSANEVEHARTCAHPVLAVVSEIAATDSEPERTVGGAIEVWDPWDVDESRLRARSYSYSLS